MADYDWYERCDVCLGRQGHEVWCRWHEHYKKFVRGFEWHGKARAFMCMRGCGTLVWDIDAHMENVCRTWDPSKREGAK